MSPEQALAVERERIAQELEDKREEHATATKIADRANAKSFRLYEECKALEERLSAIDRAAGVLA